VRRAHAAMLAAWTRPTLDVRLYSTNLHHPVYMLCPPLAVHRQHVAHSKAAQHPQGLPDRPAGMACKGSCAREVHEQHRITSCAQIKLTHQLLWPLTQHEA
jgi:hypothetical protein